MNDAVDVESWGERWFDIGDLVKDHQLVECLTIRQDFQVYECKDKFLVLAVKERLLALWSNSQLDVSGRFDDVKGKYGHVKVAISEPSRRLESTAQAHVPRQDGEVTSFLDAYSATRSKYSNSLRGSIYYEEAGFLLPVENSGEPASAEDDHIMVATWLTGGVPISLAAMRKILTKSNFLSRSTEVALQRLPPADEVEVPGAELQDFRLPGRVLLETEFNRLFVLPRRNPDSFIRFQVSMPSGILLVGKPGTGKTFAVECLARHMKANVYPLTPTEVGSHWIHETAQRIAALFSDAAKAASKCVTIIFIDELEAFCGERSRDSSSRVEETGELLRQMNNIGGQNVILIGATNRVDLVDSAFLRPGRFDVQIEVKAATTVEVEAMLADHFSGTPVGSDVAFPVIAAKLRGSAEEVGVNLANVALVCRETRRAAAERNAAAIGLVDFEKGIRCLTRC